jgi:hypothetical protein
VSVVNAFCGAEGMILGWVLLTATLCAGKCAGEFKTGLIEQPFPSLREYLHPGRSPERESRVTGIGADLERAQKFPRCARARVVEFLLMSMGEFRPAVSRRLESIRTAEKQPTIQVQVGLDIGNRHAVLDRQIPGPFLRQPVADSPRCTEVQRRATTCNDIRRYSEIRVRIGLFGKLKPSQKVRLGKRLPIAPCNESAIIEAPALEWKRSRTVHNKHAAPSEIGQHFEVAPASSLTHQNKRSPFSVDHEQLSAESTNRAIHPPRSQYYEVSRQSRRGLSQGVLCL